MGNVSLPPAGGGILRLRIREAPSGTAGTSTSVRSRLDGRENPPNSVSGAARSKIISLKRPDGAASRIAIGSLEDRIHSGSTSSPSPSSGAVAATTSTLNPKTLKKRVSFEEGNMCLQHNGNGILNFLLSV